MKKVIIYGSKWNPITGIVPFLGFMTGWIISMYHSDDTINHVTMILGVLSALCAAFCIVVLFVRKPKLIITDYSVMVNTYVPWEVCFEEVDSFYPTSYKGQDVIGIRYKKDIEAGVSIEEVEDGISMRKKTLLNPGEPYDIYVTGLSKKPKDILNLLNQRLKGIQA